MSTFAVCELFALWIEIFFKETKMKKIISLILVAIMSLGIVSLTACSDDTANTLVVWTFTKELDTMVKDYYSKKYPDVKVKVEIVEVTALEQKLDSALRAKKNLPDVVAIEEKYIDKYAKSGAFLQIEDLLPADNQMYAYTLDAAKDSEGKIIAYAWQATPGVFYYRADMAKEILGVSSPEEMQAKVSTWEGVIDVAKELKHANTEHYSDIRIFSDVQAPARAFFSDRQASWIVDGKLSIEEQLYNGEYSLYEIIKTLQVGDGEWGGKNEPYINETVERQAGWYGDMGGDKVFSYLMPSYSLQYDLKKNSEAGKWAICEGPANYSDGGTWLGVIKSSNKAEQAKEMIKYFTMDKEFLRAWADATGDFMNDKAMMAEFAADASRTESFLYGGQNQYKIFNEVAANINGNNRTAYDSTINSWFGESAVNYAKLDNNISSKADALDAFVEQIRGAYGAVVNTEDIEFDF